MEEIIYREVLKGFERVPPDQKRMDPHKFNTAL